MNVVDLFYILVIFLALYVSSFQLLLFLKYRPRKKVAKLKKMPFVSVIIPAYNEEKTIGRTIRSVLSLDYPREKLEVLVVDDGSKDRTYEIAKKFESKRVSIFKRQNRGKAAALNFGVERARGELIAVVDCDTDLERDSLLKCVKYFDEEKVACVTSRILQKSKGNILERWQDIEFKVVAYTRKLNEFINLITATPGPLSVYRKDVLAKLGKFDERCLLEDNEIAWRIIANGYKIKMAYDAKVYTKFPSRFGLWWKQRTRWGIGGLQIIEKYAAIFLRKHPVGTFLLPLSVLSYAFTSLGILLFIYLLIKTAYIAVLYYLRVLAYGGNPFIFFISFEPNLFLFYGSIMLLLNFLLMIYILTRYKTKLSVGDILSFSFVYLFLFPLVTFYSIYKFLRLYKQLKVRIVWLTK